jgi:hypothetical protein
MNKADSDDNDKTTTYFELEERPVPGIGGLWQTYQSKGKP